MSLRTLSSERSRLPLVLQSLPVSRRMTPTAPVLRSVFPVPRLFLLVDPGVRPLSPSRPTSTVSRQPPHPTLPFPTTVVRHGDPGVTETGRDPPESYSHLHVRPKDQLWSDASVVPEVTARTLLSCQYRPRGHPGTQGLLESL